jgi:predicted GNAT family N-acyltransferase
LYSQSDGRHSPAPAVLANASIGLAACRWTLVDPMTKRERFTLRVLTTASEFASAFRLRYDAYRDLGYLPAAGAHALDVDAYDARAHHVGAFAPDGDLVATARFVTAQRVPPVGRAIDDVIALAGDPDLLSLSAAEPHWPLPAIASAELASALDRVAGPGRRVCELGRVVVRRSRRGRGLHLALFTAGAAHCAEADPPVFIGSCHPDHALLWAACGFAPLPGAGEYTNPSVLRPAICLFVDGRALPARCSTPLDAFRGDDVPDSAAFSPNPAQAQTP